MESHPYGWLSLLPPLVAIVLAIVTRKATVSLLMGIFCGALLTTGGDFFRALYDTCEVHLWPTFIDPGKLRVFSFTLLMGAMIGVICRCGGMQGLIQIISPFAKTRRGGQMVTWMMGIAIFFDDYANTILLGGTLRPLCDRLKISREKLAYLVDSTAAPVAGLSLLSTWVAVEIEYVREGIETLQGASDLNAIDIFVGSIPYRFYIVASLVLIPMIALTGRDFGPMLKAERRRMRGDSLGADEPTAPEQAEDLPDDMPARWFNAVLPIVVTLGMVIWLLVATGKEKLANVSSDVAPTLRDILGAADSSFALQYGALVGLAVVVLLASVQRLLSSTQIVRAAGAGARVVLPAIAILWCASALSRMTGSKSVEGEPTTIAYQHQDHRLYTGDFLAQLIIEPDQTPNTENQASESTWTVKLLPTVVFLLAAALSFATGTSFGTMGILLPIVVTLTHALLGAAGASGTDPIMLATVGSVLAGAVFGDHCSPISDTTILSSQSCACDHIAHVVTQLPYAVLVAAVSIVCGTLPLGWGVSVWILLPLQVVALYLVLMLVGQRVETQ